MKILLDGQLTRPIRPLPGALAHAIQLMCPRLAARLYAGMSIEQRRDFWEALETTVPDAWAAARHDLRRPLVTPSETTSGTIGDDAGSGVMSGRYGPNSGHIQEVDKLGWARPMGSGQ